MPNSNNELRANRKPRFSIGQMLLMTAWLGLVFALFRSAHSHPPRLIRGYSEIAVSDTGENIAAVHWRGIHLYHNDRFSDELNVRHVDSLKFIDEETLVIVCLNSNDLPRGVHFYSLDQGRFTRWLPLTSEENVRVLLLEDKFIVQQIDKQIVGQFHVYDMNATQDSVPIASYSSPRANMPFDATSDGRFVAFYQGGTLSRNFHMWDLSGVTVEYDLEKGESTNLLGMSNGVAFSPDDTFVITCREAIQKFEWPTAKPMWSIPFDEPCGHVQFSKDGKTFAVLAGIDYSEGERRLRVFDSDSSKQLLEIKLNSKFGLGNAISADGKSVWTGPLDDQRGLAQWNIASKSVVKRIGSLQKNQQMTYYTLLLLCWAALYSKLFPKRVTVRGKRGFVFICFGIVSILNLTFSCHMVFQYSSPQHRSASLAVAVLLFCGTLFATWSFHALFGHDETDDAKVASTVSSSLDDS